MNPRRVTLALTMSASLLSIQMAAQSIPPRFEVASIKRSSAPMTVPPTVQPGGRFTTTNVMLGTLIEYAYDFQTIQVVGGPDWMRSPGTRFEINAKAAGDLPRTEIKAMLRTLLEERFKLVVHIEQREMPIQELVVNRSDGRLGERLVSVSSEEGCPAARAKLPPVPRSGGGSAVLAYTCGPIRDVARAVSSMNRVVVMDKTGLSGVWMGFMYFSLASVNPALTGDADLPSLPTALQEQLGLRTNSVRGLADVLVVESAQLPTED